MRIAMIAMTTSNSIRVNPDRRLRRRRMMNLRMDQDGREGGAGRSPAVRGSYCADSRGRKRVKTSRRNGCGRDGVHGAVGQPGLGERRPPLLAFVAPAAVTAVNRSEAGQGQFE